MHVCGTPYPGEEDDLKAMFWARFILISGSPVNPDSPCVIFRAQSSDFDSR